MLMYPGVRLSASRCGSRLVVSSERRLPKKRQFQSLCLHVSAAPPMLIGKDEIKARLLDLRQILLGGCEDLLKFVVPAGKTCSYEVPGPLSGNLGKR